jgi:serine/threonine protein kinase
MTYLSDRALARLREVADLPDLSGTRYEMIAPVGRGGMGAVYLVRDAALDRRVAMKVLHFDEVSEEARTLARLEHPGIVPIHDMGRLPDGRGYFTMKYVEGTRLDHYARANPALPALLRVFGKICEAVAFAHDHGVVHRDLKPANVMLGSYGEALVMDFGIAQSAETRPAYVAGTPEFMAPEQARGEAAGARADIFSLGAMLRELVPSPPKRLAAIVAKAASPEADSRYESALALARDLARFLDHEPVSAYRESVWERASRLAARHRTALLLILAYLLMRILLLVVQRNPAGR